MLEVAALQHLCALLCEGTGDQQLVKELVNQDVGLPAALQNHGLAIHRAKVLLHQEVGEAQGAVGVSAWGVQRVQQGLQADVAHEVIVHIFSVGVEVVFLGGVGLATHHAQGVRAGIWVICRVWLVHGSRGNSLAGNPIEYYFLRSKSRCSRSHPQTLKSVLYVSQSSSNQSVVITCG
jgi:hypothetical protein